MTDIAEYEKMLLIDRYSLDEELTRHPDAYYRISENYIATVDARDQAKQFLKGTEGQCYLAIRADLEDAGAKVTEKLIESRVLNDKAYLDARGDLQDKSAEVDRWSALKSSFDQRSYMLKALCELYAAGYFSDNAVRSGQSIKRQHEVDETRADIRQSRQRKKL